METKERYNLEFKEEVTKTFLKTVSAYSNYNDGEIIFGIDDDGNMIGLDFVEDECLKIENMINDSIDPVPNFKRPLKDEGTGTLSTFFFTKINQLHR